MNSFKRVMKTKHSSKVSNFKPGIFDILFNHLVDETAHGRFVHTSFTNHSSNSFESESDEKSLTHKIDSKLKNIVQKPVPYVSGLCIHSYNITKDT